MIAEAEQTAPPTAEARTGFRNAAPVRSSSTGRVMTEYVLPSGKKIRTVRADIFNRALKHVSRK